MLNALSRFFDWLYQALLRSLSIVASNWGLMLAACGGTATFTATLFARFTWLSPLVSRVQSATASVQAFVNGDFGPFEPLLGWLNLGALAQSLVVLVGATVGVTVLVFVTIFTVVFLLVPTVLTVRAVNKAIKAGTAGFIDP